MTAGRALQFAADRVQIIVAAEARGRDDDCTAVGHGDSINGTDSGGEGMARTGAVGDGDLLQTPVTDLQEGAKNIRTQLLEFGRAET